VIYYLLDGKNAWIYPLTKLYLVYQATHDQRE
jgi:hypothetical protein